MVRRTIGYQPRPYGGLGMERDGTIRASWQTIRRAYGHCSRGCRAALIGMSTHQQTSLRLVFDPLKRS